LFPKSIVDTSGTLIRVTLRLSESAFLLSAQFTRWLEIEGVYSDVDLLRDLMQREQFQSNLDSELRVLLIDQKPKNLSKVARLADQYVAVRKADRAAYKVKTLLPKVMLLSQSQLVSQVVIKLVWASRNHHRLATMLSLTMSRSHQLLQTVPNTIVPITTGHPDYVFTVRNLGTSCLTVPSDGQN